MSTADDLRDLRDALDSIAHGALPRWGKPTTKMGEEAQVAAREVYERWVRALHHESAAKFAIAKAQVAENDHRTHAHAMTERCETVERERDALRATLDTVAHAHERDILAIWHEATDAIHPPQSVQDVLAAVRKLRQERNAANRESACVCLMPTLGHDIQCPARRYKP